MELYTETLAKALQDAASLGDQPTQEVARRLLAVVEPSLRLTVLQVLTDVAEEVSTELDGAQVSVVMNGGVPSLQVTERPSVPLPPPPAEPVGSGEPAGPEGQEEDEAEVRTTLRMPAALRREVDAAAQAQGRSVNAWLVDAVRQVLSRGGGDGYRGQAPQGGPYQYTRPPQDAWRSSPTLNGWFA